MDSILLKFYIFKNKELKNGWLIMSPKKTFCVYATTSREKIEWMTHISNCIEKLPDGKLIHLLFLTN